MKSYWTTRQYVAVDIKWERRLKLSLDAHDKERNLTLVCSTMTSLFFHVILSMSQVARHLHVCNLLSFLSRVRASRGSIRYRIMRWLRKHRHPVSLCDDVTGTFSSRLRPGLQGETDPAERYKYPFPMYATNANLLGHMFVWISKHYLHERRKIFDLITCSIIVDISEYHYFTKCSHLGINDFSLFGSLSFLTLP